MHPTDERLSAVAWGEPEALADLELASHVSACSQCAQLTSDLRLLRASLAELPDLQPPRPLQLVPPVPETPNVVGFSRVLRRLVAPAFALGVVLIIVGSVGTAAPLFSSSAGAALFENVGSNLEGNPAAPGVGAAASAAPSGARTPVSSADAARPSATVSGSYDRNLASSSGSARPTDQQFSSSTKGAVGNPEDGSSPSEPPYPLVLVAGLALVVAAGGVRLLERG